MLLQFGTNLISLDTGVVLQLQEYFKAAKTLRTPRHIPAICGKREGFPWSPECGWIGLPMRKKGAKIELLQKSARESGA